MRKIVLGIKFLHLFVPACCHISVNGRYHLMPGHKYKHNCVIEGKK